MWVLLDSKIPLYVPPLVLVQKLWWFRWMGGFCLLVELHREGSAPEACAAGLFFFIYIIYETISVISKFYHLKYEFLATFRIIIIVGLKVTEIMESLLTNMFCFSFLFKETLLDCWWSLLTFKVHCLDWTGWEESDLLGARLSGWERKNGGWEGQEVSNGGWEGQEVSNACINQFSLWGCVILILHCLMNSRSMVIMKTISKIACLLQNGSSLLD